MGCRSPFFFFVDHTCLQRVTDNGTKGEACQLIYKHMFIHNVGGPHRGKVRGNLTTYISFHSFPIFEAFGWRIRSIKAEFKIPRWVLYAGAQKQKQNRSNFMSEKQFNKGKVRRIWTHQWTCQTWGGTTLMISCPPVPEYVYIGQIEPENPKLAFVSSYRFQEWRENGLSAACRGNY